MAHVQEQKKLEEMMTIPDGVEVTLDGHSMIIKGKLGTVQRRIGSLFVNLKKDKNTITLSSPSSLRKNKRMLYTTKSHISNMIYGVQHGYTYKLKMCAGHFPITAKVEGQVVTISNFLGEKIPRKSKILPHVAVTIDKDLITVQSPDLEAAGQTAANLEQTTGVGKRDRRVFQDGCYIIEKPGRTVT